MWQGMGAGGSQEFWDSTSKEQGEEQERGGSGGGGKGTFRLPVPLGHRWQTQGLRAKSRPAPCFYLAAAPSSHLTVKE